MKVSPTNFLLIFLLIAVYGTISSTAAPHKLQEICINPPQCVGEDDCCCGYVCVMDSPDDPRPACYPVYNTSCPPKGPFHKTQKQKNGYKGCSNPTNCVHESDCCCGFTCVMKIEGGKNGFLDSFCAAGYDRSCPPEYEGLDDPQQIRTKEVDGEKETMLQIVEIMAGIDGYFGDNKETIIALGEDKSTDCRNLADVCDIFHMCCTGYSCTGQDKSIVGDPLRTGICKTVMVEPELKK